MERIKIDKIPVEMYRTVHKKDAYGNRVRDKEKYIGYRKIKGIETGPRIGHAFIDAICFQIIYQSLLFLIGLIALAVSRNVFNLLTVQFVSSLIALVIYPAFYFLFEYYLQRTPGKYITKTLVVNEYNEKPDFGTMILRSVIRIVPFEAFSCFSDTNRGWHDRWSNTYVLTKKEHEELKVLLQNKQTI